MDQTEILVTEWPDIRDSLRAFGNKRFAQLTVFMAATGFMFDGFLKQTERAPRLALTIVGIVLGVLFLVMEISAVRYWDQRAFFFGCGRAKRGSITTRALQGPARDGRR